MVLSVYLLHNKATTIHTQGDAIVYLYISNTRFYFSFPI